MLDWNFITETVIPSLNQGLWVTATLILPSAIIGGILGFILGILRVFASKPIQRLCDYFSILVRGVPLTVQLMILYFGLPNLGIYFDPYPAAVIGFIICTSAYQSEYVRGALLSIKQGQLKAAYALGMTKFQTIISVILPQAAKRALPGCGNEVIYLIKYSSLAYIITCIELTGQAKILVSRTFMPTEVYFITALYYLALVTLASYILKKAEEKLTIPQH